jgi:exopolysaccharide production protein ExoZ
MKHIDATGEKSGDKKSHEILWLQGLRGIACILVVLCHARYFMLNTPAWPFAEQLFIPGAAGVDLFFVISGFIMTYTTVRPGATSLDFLRQRFTRIWPPYVVMTLIWVFFVDGRTLMSLLSPDVGIPLLKSLFFIPVNPQAPLYFNVTLPLGWTLEFEAYFYLIFAISMLFGRLRWAALFAWFIYSALIFPMKKRGLDLDVMKDLGYSFGYAALVTNPIVIDFLFGVVAGALYLSRIRIRSVRLCWNLLFISTAFALWSCYSMYYKFHGPLQWGIPMALLVCVLAIVSKTIAVKFPAIILWLGRISFSLYLTHTATQQRLMAYAMQKNVDVHSWSFIFISTAAAIFIAYFFYEIVEVRLCNYIRKALTKAGSSPRQPLESSAEAQVR